jgi:hypothetical protein
MQEGEALVLAPSGLTTLQELGRSSSSNDGDEIVQESGKGHQEAMNVVPLGRRFMIVKTRRRVTADGGASVLVV